MANVRFYSGTRAQYDSLLEHNPLALYFCDDTGELFKGDVCLSDGIRIVPTRSDLPECSCAADGIVYFVAETKSGFMVSPDRTEWLQTIYAPVTDAYTIPEEEMYTTVTTVGAVRDIEKKIYERIEEVVISGISGLTAVDGTIKITDTEDGGKSIGVVIAPDANNALRAVDSGLFVPQISVKQDESNGLVAIDGELSLNLATRKSSGAMSVTDKLIVDSIPYVYEQRKYDILDTPMGALVDYREREIRVMIPENAEFKKQAVGENGDSDTYYMGLRTYAPDDGVVGYIEHIGDQTDSEILTDISIDEYGRRYQTTWLGLAKYDKSTDTWSYYGKNSSIERFIGWDYRIDWYDKNNVKVASDSVRINLSNEECHNSLRPYYGPNSDLSTDVTELQETLAEMREMYSWSEM
jgi:hypothetical protein